MAADRAKVLDKLKKLRAHAQSAAQIRSEEEAASFANMVQAMIVKHNIEQSELDALELEEELKVNPMKEISLPWSFLSKHKQRKAWLEDLATFVAHAHFCELLVSQTRFAVFFVGREAQAQMAADVYMQLANTAKKLAQAEYFKHYHEVRGDSSNASIRGFKPAFLSAFTSRLGTRYRRKMTELQNDIDASAGAMVLFKSEAQLLKEFIENLLAPKKVRVEQLTELFKYGDTRPSLKLRWQQGCRWALIMGEKTLLALHMTELDALKELEEEHGYQAPKDKGAYHRIGYQRGEAAADRLNLGSNPPPKRQGLLNDS